MGISHVAVPILVPEHVSIPIEFLWEKFECSMYQLSYYIMSIPMGKMGIFLMAVTSPIPKLRHIPVFLFVWENMKRELPFPTQSSETYALRMLFFYVVRACTSLVARVRDNHCDVSLPIRECDFCCPAAAAAAVCSVIYFTS